MADDGGAGAGKGIFWLASYPKSGNTWTRAFLANLRRPGKEAVEVNELFTGAIASSRSWVEEGLGINVDELNHDEVDRLRPRAYHWLAENAPTRHHKVHDAWTRLPGGEPLFPAGATRGAVYLARNPLDVVLSWANHSSISVEASVQQICNPRHALCRSRRGLSNQLRQIHGTWSEHVLSWLDSDVRKLVLRYEDLKRDPVAAFTAVAAFFELEAEPQEIAAAVRKSRFDRLRRSEEQSGFTEKAPRVKHFFRKGVVGEWRQKLTPEQVERVVEANRTGMERLGYLDGRGRPRVRPGPFRVGEAPEQAPARTPPPARTRTRRAARARTGGGPAAPASRGARAHA